MEVNFEISGITGTAIVPDGTDKKETWMVFHGYGGNGAFIRAQLELEAANPDVNIIYFDAPTRNDTVYWEIANNGDANTIMAIMLELSQFLPIDIFKLKAVGHSNGGFFCHKLVNRFPNSIQGAVILCANLPSSITATYPGNIVAINGGNDATIDIEAGATSTGLAYMSATDTGLAYTAADATITTEIIWSAPHNLTLYDTSHETSFELELAQDLSRYVADRLNAI